MKRRVIHKWLLLKKLAVQNVLQPHKMDIKREETYSSDQVTGINTALRGLWSKAHLRVQGRFTCCGLQLELVLEAATHTAASRAWAKTFAFFVLSQLWKRNGWRFLSRLRRKKTRLLFTDLRFTFQMKVNMAFYLEIMIAASGGRVERHPYKLWKQVLEVLWQVEMWNFNKISTKCAYL